MPTADRQPLNLSAVEQLSVGSWRLTLNFMLLKIQRKNYANRWPPTAELVCSWAVERWQLAVNIKFYVD
jgi:hypothetical protein